MRYEMRYWQIALTVFEAVAANHARLNMEEPKAPANLLPPKFKPEDPNVFPYKLTWKSGVDPESGNAATAVEVCTAIKEHLMSCDYKSFSVKFSRNTDGYTIYIHTNAGYANGTVKAVNMGLLDYDNQTGYFVRYFRGGSSPIRANVPFEVYIKGVWLDTMILPNAEFAQLCAQQYKGFCSLHCTLDCGLKLTRFNVHPNKFIGEIVRL